MAEEEIRQTKEELVKARIIRRNRMEYDAMAKVINKNPDRATQEKKIEDVTHLSTIVSRRKKILKRYGLERE